MKLWNGFINTLNSVEFGGDIAKVVGTIFIFATIFGFMLLFIYVLGKLGD